VVQLNFIVNTIVALSLAEGSVSAVTLAFSLMLMPQIAIAQSAAIAAMPTFSAQAALGKLDELRKLLAGTLRVVLLLAVPATVGLIALRLPLVRFLYQRGEFTAQSTSLVAWALFWYTAGLVGHSLVEVLARAFYALQDTKTPVLIGSAAMILNVIFSLTFPHLFNRAGWMPHGGLALANSLATALEAVGLLILIRRRLGGLEGRSILDGGGRALVAALGMALALWGWLEMTGGRASWLVTAGGVILGGVVYGVGVVGLGVREARGAVRAIARRFLILQ
jgi:putative peptidoglycan lipid II flippase